MWQPRRVWSPLDTDRQRVFLLTARGTVGDRAPGSMLPLKAPGAGWYASLDLRFAKLGDATRLVGRRHQGPLVVQRPFHPEGPGVCHVYILHPPGGLVAGDRLSLGVTADDGAHALVTTPAAAKIYRSATPDSEVVTETQVKVGDHATVEWLPQETVVFSGGQVRVSTKVVLAETAQFIGWEILCMGRPACEESFSSGVCRQALEVIRNDRPLFIERTPILGGGPMLGAAWGMAGRPVLGTFLATADALDEQVVTSIRKALQDETATTDDIASVTLMEGLVVCRYLGHSVERARTIFEGVRTRLRPILLGMMALAPRIWAT